MHKLLTALLILLFASCDLFQPKNPEEIVARVGKNYLYKSDIEKQVASFTSKEDSALLVNNYINRWATQQLLMEKAEINLSEEKLESYNNLVESYKIDLYTRGYKDIMATRMLDSIISHQELENYYASNTENFLLNEELIQLRYIHVGKDNTSIANIKQQLIRFNEKDKEELQQKQIQFKTHFLNDSVWVRVSNAADAIPVITPDNSDQLLKKSNFIELQDSLGVYLVQIKDVLSRNEIAPLSYVQPTIEQIILNGRKLEIIKKLEKDIIEDAIRSKNFEVFN